MNGIDLTNLLEGIYALSWGGAVMMLVGGLLIYLAIAKEYEPVLLLPIGIGCIFANLPLSFLTGEEGILTLLYQAGVANELFPLLIFIGVGAMIDFRPLLAQPKFVLMGAAGQFGIYGTLILATLLGFELQRVRQHRHHRRHRRPDRHLCHQQARPAHDRPDHGGRLLVYEPGTHHSAPDHAVDDHQQRAPYQDGLLAPGRSASVP